MAFKKKVYNSYCYRTLYHRVSAFLSDLIFLPSLLSLLLSYCLYYFSVEMPVTLSTWFLYQNYSSQVVIVSLTSLESLCHLNISIKYSSSGTGLRHTRLYILALCNHLLQFKFTFLWHGLLISGVMHLVMYHLNCSTICDDKFYQRNHIAKT